MKIIYDRRAIMQYAWCLYRSQRLQGDLTLGECIQHSWSRARQDARMWSYGHRPHLDLFFLTY